MYHNNRHPTFYLLPLEASGPDAGIMDDVSNRDWQTYSTAKLLVFNDGGWTRAYYSVLAAANLRMPLFLSVHCPRPLSAHLPTPCASSPTSMCSNLVTHDLMRPLTRLLLSLRPHLVIQFLLLHACVSRL